MRNAHAPDGYNAWRDALDQCLLIPEPANPDNSCVHAAGEAWHVVFESVGRLFKNLDTCVSVDDAKYLAMWRARYSAAEWDAYVAGVRDGRFVTHLFDGLDLEEYPMDLEVLVLTRSRDAKTLWLFLRVHLRRLARVRRFLYAWYAPHCGNPAHMDFEQDLASATAGLY